MRATSILVIACMVLSCTTTPLVQTPRRPNPRIVYRDLTVPVAYKVPAPLSDDGVAAAQPQFYIEFANESHNTFDVSTLKGFERRAQSGDLILIVGHSHGHSAVGTLVLASKRAETIARHLRGRGYENVQVMAAWGPRSIDFAPSRGVHLYVIAKHGLTRGLHIVFARQVSVPKEDRTRDETLDMADQTSPRTLVKT